MDEAREAREELEAIAHDDAADAREWEAFHADLNSWRPVSEYRLPMADNER